MQNGTNQPEQIPDTKIVETTMRLEQTGTHTLLEATANLQTEPEPQGADSTPANSGKNKPSGALDADVQTPGEENEISEKNDTLPVSTPSSESAAETALDHTEQIAPSSDDPDIEKRYDNKYAKQYRADLDLLPDGAEKNYLLDRVFPQMTYYSDTSAAYKKAYYRLTIACIILNGVIPFIMLFEDVNLLAPFVRFIVTALSSTAGILTAISALKKHRELWIQYRVCLEQMKQVVSMYFVGADVFSGLENEPEQRRKTLFAVCENILSSEHSHWIKLSKAEKEPT